MIKKCENCDYEQELRDDRKARHSWRCYDCHHSNKLTFVVIAAILAFGSLGLVYAEEVNLPLDEVYDDSWCTFLAFDERVRFTCNWDWLLPDYVITEINQTDIPARISDMPQHNLDLGDKIRLLLERGEPIVPDIKDIPEVQPDEEEPLTIEQKQIQIALDKLDECRTGSGAWAAFMEQGAIEFYVNQSRFLLGTGKTGYEQHQLLKIAMAIEECRIMDKGARAGTVSVAHLHAYMADVLGLDYLGREQTRPSETDFTDRMVHTDPITEKDIAKEIEQAERYLREEAPWMDPTLGCIPTEEDPNRCLNRGSQPAGKLCDTKGQPAPIGVYATTICPLDSYNQFILENIKTITYGDILEQQCDAYYGVYEHKVGTEEFPAWLNHCVPEVDEE